MLSRGIRGSAGGFARPAAYVAAAALVVTAMAVAMWAGPLAGAGARTQSHASAPPRARVKFYIVPPPEDGSAESLFAIAATTLGDGGQFMEIFNLNKGRLQPDGGRLTSPQTIEPGWILRLPADAAGPGVHIGLLPAVARPASHRPSRPAAGVAASSHFPSLSGAAGSATVISGALLALLAAGMAFGLFRRRAIFRRIPMHVRAPRGPAADRTGSSAAMGPKMPSAGPGWERPRVPGPVWQAPAGRSGQGIPQLPGDQGTAPADLSWAGEPVRLANRILSDADQQAAEIRQQAACQAGDMREAAERDAAELRATLMEMSAELGRMAAYVTGILQTTATPATARAAWPGKSPATRPATKSATRPAEPVTMPGEPPTQPARPAAKPATRSRQFRAARLPVLAMGVALLFGLIAATTEMALHGYDFFVFRPPGTGATQQGPPGPAPSRPPTAHRHYQATRCAQAGTRGAHHHSRPDTAQATSAERR